MPGPEGKLQRRVLTYLKTIPGLEARKRHGTAFGVAGDPDIYLLYQGVHAEIELKAPGQTPTPLQLRRLAEWKAAGALTLVASTLDEVKALIEELQSRIVTKR
ncbi:MAG TPA: hypothetical protein VH110_05310 [Candidatus Acidoferrum sp.]|jgi:hypothetical protein|nr:hypothetical protein [Candidatus Acidoferrum sp.]